MPTVAGGAPPFAYPYSGGFGNGLGGFGPLGGIGGGVFGGSNIFGGYSSGTSLFSPLGGFSNNNTTMGPFTIDSSSSSLAF